MKKKDLNIKVKSYLSPTKYNTAETLWSMTVGMSGAVGKQLDSVDPKILSMVQKFFFLGIRICLDNLTDIMEDHAKKKSLEVQSSEELEAFEEEFMVELSNQLIEAISSKSSIPLIEIIYE